MPSKKGNYRCDFCKAEFGLKSSLTNHSKSCQKKRTIINRHHEEIGKLKYHYENEIRQLKLHYENKIKDMELVYLNKFMEKDEIYHATIKDTNDSIKKIAESVGKVTEESTKLPSKSAFSKINDKFQDAPTIKKFKDFELLKMHNNAVLETDKSISEYIIFYFEKGLLAKQVSDVIVYHYKKDKKSEQSIWSTDGVRFSYAIRELVGNEPMWIRDKNGIKVSKYAIQPIKDYVSSSMNTYAKSRMREIYDIIYMNSSPDSEDSSFDFLGEDDGIRHYNIMADDFDECSALHDLQIKQRLAIKISEYVNSNDFDKEVLTLATSYFYADEAVFIE